MSTLKIFVFSLFLSTYLFGQDSLITKPHPNSDWNFRVGPYFWFLGINATLEKPPVPSTLPEYADRSFILEKSFSEVANSLKFAFLINTDYQKNRWLGVLNGTSVILGGAAVTPRELVVKGLNYRLSLAFGEALAGYQVVSKPKFKIDMLGGAKIFYSKVTGSGSFIGERDYSASRTVTWVEPIIATRFKYYFTPKIEAIAYLDYGPIRSESELINQYAIWMNFLLNRWLYVAPGYRYWLFRKSSNQSIFNGQIYGFYFRIGAQF